MPIPPHLTAVVSEMTGPMRATPNAAFGFEATVRFDPLLVKQGGEEFRALLQRPHVIGRSTAAPMSDFERLLQKEFKPNTKPQPQPGRFGITRPALRVLGYAAWLVTIATTAKEVSDNLTGKGRRTPAIEAEDEEIMYDVLAIAAKVVEGLPRRIDGNTLSRKRREKSTPRTRLHAYSRRAHS
jgi:hypothetical protein